MSVVASALILDATAPTLTEAQLRQRAMAAKDAGLFGLCVLSGRVRQAAIMVARSNVHICTLIGFPTGVQAASVKALETRLALQDGAYDIAVTANLGYFFGEEELQLANEIAYVAKTQREVAPAKAHNLAIVIDMDAMPLTGLARLSAQVQRSGGHGFYLCWQVPPAPDQLRTVFNALSPRLTIDLITIHSPIADTTTAQAWLAAGAHYLVTPHAIELAGAM